MTDKDVKLAISQARQSILSLLEENKSYRIVRDEVVSLPLQSAAWEEMNPKHRQARLPVLYRCLGKGKWFKIS